jgi:hypothetical protein
MWIKNFVNNWIDTSKKIYQSGIETMNRDKLNFIQFFWHALKQSCIWAYYVFLKWEIDSFLKANEVQSVQNETSNKVAYLIWWYYISPATLLNLKQKLENEWIQTEIINQRYYSKKTITQNILSLKNKLNNNQWKDIVLFWYSSWWMIAHRIWKKSWYKSVSFWLSEDPARTMVWTLVSLTEDKQLKKIDIPDSWTNIIESFSAIVPNDENIWINTHRLEEIYSHMTIWDHKVIEEISKNILQLFNSTRI